MIKMCISVTSQALDPLPLSQTVTPSRIPFPLEHDVLYGRPLSLMHVGHRHLDRSVLDTVPVGSQIWPGTFTEQWSQSLTSIALSLDCIDPYIHFKFSCPQLMCNFLPKR